MGGWIVLISIIFSIMCLINGWKAESENIDLKFKYKEIKREFSEYKVSSKCAIETLKIELNKHKEDAERWEKEAYQRRFQDVRWGYGYKPQRNTGNTLPDGTLEAVKYAMNKSHPDNGGNQEDFIKFRKLYEDLKGMN